MSARTQCASTSGSSAFSPPCVSSHRVPQVSHSRTQPRGGKTQATLGGPVSWHAQVLHAARARTGSAYSKAAVVTAEQLEVLSCPVAGLKVAAAVPITQRGGG